MAHGSVVRRIPLPKIEILRNGLAIRTALAAAVVSDTELDRRIITFFRFDSDNPVQPSQELGDFTLLEDLAEFQITVLIPELDLFIGSHFAGLLPIKVRTCL